MSGNTFGSIFRITTFGESHGAGLGVTIDGVPAGLSIDLKKIQDALDRRKPGAKINGLQSASVTSRSEPDSAEIISGVFQDKSTGTPITILIRNTSQHSSDYGNMVNTFRPGHADFTYDAKYGFRDYRGGGRSSGRETAARVAAGAIAQMILEQYGIKVTAYTIKACGVSIKKRDLSQIEQNSLRAPDNEAASQMEQKIAELRSKGESGGGIVECIAQGVPAGLGEPVFDKLDAELAKAMLSIGAIKGIEFGEGFAVSDLIGSQNNDSMHAENAKPCFDTNNSGGILGGISTGEQIIFRVPVKPVPSIFNPQNTVCKNGESYESTTLQIKGRHDVCLCPRIVPVVEAMTSIVLADMLLRNKTSRISQ